MRPGPSKIDPGTTQNALRTTKSNNKRSGKCKMRPRSAQERKIAPTWLQHGVRRIGSVERLASPKVDTTGVFYLYIQHIGLTRLGTDDGAADWASAQYFFN